MYGVDLERGVGTAGQRIEKGFKWNGLSGDRGGNGMGESR